MPFPDPEDAPRHGGDLTFARQRHGDPLTGWLDLSTGINPHPYPAPEIDPVDLHRLPDRGRLIDLLDAARRTYVVPEAAALVAAPGSETAIQAIPLLVPHRRVAIVGPTYGSHRQAWHGADKEVIDCGSLADIPSDAAVVVLANPNNPDGRTVAPDDLAGLARRLAARDGLLVVDEAFADLTPEVSLIPQLTDIHAIVLRSLGKFHGLAGLRLGFVAGQPAMTARLERLFGAWPVSGAALTIGRAALADRGWAAATRVALGVEAGRLREVLAARGLPVIGGTDLFVLIENTNAGRLHGALAERGIWTRAFAERTHWLRFGLPADDHGFARLDRALADCTALTADR
jgi:cobalamin biosynthesis protein CobC